MVCLWCVVCGIVVLWYSGWGWGWGIVGGAFCGIGGIFASRARNSHTEKRKKKRGRVRIPYQECRIIVFSSYRREFIKSLESGPRGLYRRINRLLHT